MRETDGYVVRGARPRVLVLIPREHDRETVVGRLAKRWVCIEALSEQGAVAAATAYASLSVAVVDPRAWERAWEGAGGRELVRRLLGAASQLCVVLYVDDEVVSRAEQEVMLKEDGAYSVVSYHALDDLAEEVANTLGVVHDPAAGSPGSPEVGAATLLRHEPP